MNTATELRRWCATHNMPKNALNWLDTLPNDTPIQNVYEACKRGDWLLWGLYHAGIKLEPVMPAVCAASNRAVREHLPIALRAAGLNAEAEHLESLPEIVSTKTAEVAASAAAAAWATSKAADTAWAAVSAAWAADTAARAADATWTAPEAAAEAAAEVARASATATVTATGADPADSWSVGWAAADAEHQQCAEHVRALMPWETITKEINPRILSTKGG